MSDSDKNFFDMYNNEFKTLIDIGNSFRICYHKTTKVDITDHD